MQGFSVGACSSCELPGRNLETRTHIALPEVPSSAENHGWVWKDDVLEPLWTSGSILPQKLVDILDEGNADTEDRNSDVNDSDLDEHDEYLEDEASDDD